jgi:hypothetical protein
METDDVLKHSSGVPCIARRATIPLSLRRANRLAKPSADCEMKFTYTISHFSGHRSLLRCTGYFHPAPSLVGPGYCFERRCGINLISEVGDRGFGVHAECGGDEFRVQRVDEVHQPCDAQRADAVPAAVEDVSEVRARGRGTTSFGAPRDDYMRIEGAKPISVFQAALQDGPGRRVQRHRLRAVAQLHGSSAVVDVVDAQQPCFAAAGGVQQCEHSDERLVRVHCGVSGPAPKQCPADGEGQGGTLDGVGFLGRKLSGWVDEDHPAGLEHGRIVRISPDVGELAVVADTGGRPLGLAVARDGRLLICDIHRGVLALDSESGKLDVLVESVAGRRLQFCSNVTEASDDTIYFTESPATFRTNTSRAPCWRPAAGARGSASTAAGSATTLLEGL